MEVEYTKYFVPEIKRVKETLTIFKHKEESEPVIKDKDGHIIGYQEWECLAYRIKQVTPYEESLIEEWQNGLLTLEMNEYQVIP